MKVSKVGQVKLSNAPRSFCNKIEFKIVRQVPQLEFALLLLQHLILAGLVVRVIVTGLFRTYPYFFGYLLVNALQALMSPFLNPNSRSYIYPYVTCQATLTFFCGLIVLELYTLILRDLAGIASMSRRYLKVCLALAIVGSLLLLLLEQTPHTMVTTFMVIDRTLVTSMLIFVLMLTGFVVYYPIPINRNLIVYSSGYAVYFIAKATGLLLLNINYSWLRQFGLVVVTASTIAMLFWLLGLRLAGEQKTLIIGHRWNHKNQDELLAQLKAINASLLRSGR